MGASEQRPDAAYTYNPMWRWIQREWHILLFVALVVAGVVSYRAFFPQQSISKERLPKYLRVLSDFESLSVNLHQIRDRELEKKTAGGVGAINFSGPKQTILMIWDYMFVWEMRPDSPFYKGFPKREKELIGKLISVGNAIDGFIIRLADSSGNPEAAVDFAKIRDDLKSARAIYDAEAAVEDR